uniref:BolA-like protein n=1 Tax=Lotharella oceanica TaxID=641309 RepID=A0A7S2TV98_9EUKA
MADKKQKEAKTGITKDTLAKVLKERVKGLEQCIVVDTSGGCGAMFELYLVTKEFEGVALLERHRMIQNTLKEELKEIHALSMKTWTPAQWEKKKHKLEGITGI